MKVTIMGGGLAGVSIAYFLQQDKHVREIHIIEKEEKAGGLCRSFLYDGRWVDIGPHIFFSKDKDTLQFMLGLLGDNYKTLRRSNRILYKNRLVQYPFENDLSSLPREDCEKCVETFLHNPYRQYEGTNMLQFFLKTFGEGITNMYLRPYNEKIWKFDPAFMDTQMVERIPCPPDEDILRSALGECVDGYIHQLYFSYPSTGGTETLIQGFMEKFQDKVKLHTGQNVVHVAKKGAAWQVSTDKSIFESDILISCIPVNELISCYAEADRDIRQYGKMLKYNHIMIALAIVSSDYAGDNYAFMIPDPDVIFHRLSKVDFLGENYHKEGTATYMMEYTYKDGDPGSCRTDAELEEAFVNGLMKIQFIRDRKELQKFTVWRFPYAYIIYDLKHRDNMKKIREYFKEQGVILNGRFGNFEYWNMDKVISESKKTADYITMKILSPEAT